MKFFIIVTANCYGTTIIFETSRKCLFLNNEDLQHWLELIKGIYFKKFELSENDIFINISFGDIYKNLENSKNVFQYIL